jgi:predicted ester cyclase
VESEVEVIARRAIDAINDRTIRARADELLDPSIVRHDLAQLFPDSKGTRDGSDFVEMLVAAMPDLRLDVEDIFGSGDRVAVRLRIAGTHTGQLLLGRSATANGSRQMRSSFTGFNVDASPKPGKWSMGWRSSVLRGFLDQPSEQLDTLRCKQRVANSYQD